MLSDHDAREHLKNRGIKSIPVTIVDDSDVIIGYYPKKLIQSLKLETSVDLSAVAHWLADKYEVILGAAVRAVNQSSQAQLDQTIPWRPQTLRSLLLHVISFPELAYMAHETGHMISEDMQASNQRRAGLTSPDAIAAYGEEVGRDVAAFLRSGNTTGFERVVPAHYGGEVTVMELLNIILRHSTHHLKQVYHFMGTDLGLVLDNPATEGDMDGIPTPVDLI